MNDKTKAPASEIFEQALKNYEQALKTGLKLQEESGKMVTDLLNQATSMEDWQKKVTAMTKDAIPTAQKRMNECVGLIEQNSKTSLDLLKKAVDATLVPPGPEAQNRWMDLWESSLSNLRDNAKAITEINTKVVDTWLEFVRKNAETATPKSAKA